jgi:hypothetical protein
MGFLPLMSLRHSDPYATCGTPVSASRDSTFTSITTRRSSDRLAEPAIAGVGSSGLLTAESVRPSFTATSTGGTCIDERPQLHVVLRRPRSAEVERSGQRYKDCAMRWSGLRDAVVGAAAACLCAAPLAGQRALLCGERRCPSSDSPHRNPASWTVKDYSGAWLRSCALHLKFETKSAATSYPLCSKTDRLLAR